MSIGPLATALLPRLRDVVCPDTCFNLIQYSLDGVVVPIVEIVKETVDAVPRSVQRAVVEGASSLAALDVVSHPHPVGIAPLLIVIIPVGTGVGVLVGGTGVGGTGTLK
jgi:hypothetical protein